MISPARFGIVAAMTAKALLWSAGASAQMAPPPTSPSSSPTGSMMANPYLNPYLNPYMNPLAAQQPINRNSALLYLYAANNANGGIGTGRISGLRGQPPRTTKVAEMPNSAHPGGGAARYFNPGPVNSGGAGRYYNRGSRYFQNNGR